MIKKNTIRPRVFIKGDYETQLARGRAIVEDVALRFGFTPEDLRRRNRKRPLVIARAVASLKLVIDTEITFKDIDELVRGKRDHTQVVFYAQDVIPALKTDPTHGPHALAIMEELKVAV